MARRLSPEDRERLLRELAPLAVLGPRPPAPQSVAWVKSERGRAVLATDTGPSDAEISEGADAIAGMWRDLREDAK